MTTPELSWMVVATKLIGTKEIPGKANNKEILQWAKILELSKQYTEDSIPWCGLYTAYCLAEGGCEPIKDPLWALNWAKLGTAVQPAFGAIMVFKRTGGGHVGFAVGQDDNSYHILGGNQGDAVSVTRVSKSQFVAARWPSEHPNWYRPGLVTRSLNSKLSTSAGLQ